MKYKNKHFKSIPKENESKFDDYRNEDVDEKEEHINKKVSNLRLRKLIHQKKLIELLWDFDAVSSYPSAMWDSSPIYPRVETGYAFSPDINDELVQKFNTGNFTKGSALLKIKYHNPRDLVVQDLPVNESVKKIEINRLRNGFVLDHLTSVDIQEIEEIGGKVIKICEGVIYKKTLR